MNTTIRISFGTVFVALAFSAWAEAQTDLPKGAKARLGSTVLRDINGWSNAALAPDGKALLLQTPRGLLKFDLATGKSSPMTGEKNSTFSRQLRLSENGERIVSVNYADVAVWDAATGKTRVSVKRPLPFGESTASLSKDGKLLAVGGSQNFNMKDKALTAVVWDVEKNERAAEVFVLQNQDVQVLLAPDGKLLATWGRHQERNPVKGGLEPENNPNFIVQLWDVTAGKELARFTIEKQNPEMVFSPDGATLAVGTGYGTIRLVNPRTGTEKRRVFGRSDQGVRLAYSPSGKRLATAGADGTVQIWDSESGRRIGTHLFPLGAASLSVRGMAFISDDRTVAWTAAGMTALAWDVQAGKMLREDDGHVAGVRSVVFRENEIATGGDDGQVLIWSPEGKFLRDVKLRNPAGFSAINRFPMAQVQIVPDGTRAIAQMLQQGVFDLQDGNQISSPQIGVGFNMRSFLCSDAKTFLSLPFAPYPPNPQLKAIKLAVWDAESGTRVSELEMPPCELQNAVLTPDRNKLATVTVTRDEKTTEWQITTWEVKSGKKLGTHTGMGGYGPTHLACGDNDTLLTSIPGGKVVVLNLADGKISREIETGRRGLTCHPAFTKDGKTFALSPSGAFGAATAEILLFDAATGEPKGKFRGHSGPVQCLAFNADGTRLASGSADTTVLVWDVSAAEK